MLSLRLGDPVASGRAEEALYDVVFPDSPADECGQVYRCRQQRRGQRAGVAVTHPHVGSEQVCQLIDGLVKERAGVDQPQYGRQDRCEDTGGDEQQD